MLNRFREKNRVVYLEYYIVDLILVIVLVCVVGIGLNLKDLNVMRICSFY